MPQNSNEQRKYDEDAERLLRQIQDLEELLEGLPKKYLSKKKTRAKNDGEVETVKVRNEFVTREVVDFLLDDRPSRVNLLIGQDSGSFFLRCTKREDKWLIFYKYAGDSDSFGVRVNRCIGELTEGELNFYASDSFFEIKSSAVKDVNFSWLYVDGHRDKCMVTIATETCSWVICDDGMLGSVLK